MRAQPAPSARPADITTWLEERDLHSYFNWVCWVRETRAVADAIAGPRIDAIGPDRANQFVGLVNQIFSSEPNGIGSWFGCTIGRAGWTHYIGYDHERPVAIGSLFVQNGTGWLGWGGTLWYTGLFCGGMLGGGIDGGP